MAQNKLRKIATSVFIYPLLEKKFNLFRVFFALLLLSLSQSIFLLLVGPFLKTMFSLDHSAAVVKGSLFLSERMQSLFPLIAREEFNRQYLSYGIPALLVMAAALKNYATYLYQMNSSYFGLLIAKKFRDRLFAGILRLSYREISKKSAAEWMSLLMNDVLYLQNKFSDIANGLVRESILTFAAFLTLFFIHWPTALMLLLLTPIMAYGVGRTGRKIAKYAEAFQRKIAQIADLVLEIRKRFEVIKAHRAEDYEVSRFSKLNEEYFETVKKSFLVRSIFSPFLEFVSYAILAGIIIYFTNSGGLQSHFAPSDLIVFLAAVGTMMKPLRQIGEQLTQFHETKGAIGKSLYLLDDLSRVREDGFHPLKKDTAIGDVIMIGHLASGFDKSHLLDVNDLELTRGKSIAIVGPSGGGKSTLLKTLSGLLDPFKWEVNLSYDDMRSSTSLVSQMPFLFNETVLNNLKYGLNSDINESDLNEALELAFIKEEVLKFSDGVLTELNPIRSNISGGQKQRLVLVRALLRNKTILLLDEATSAIDPRMEEQIIDKLTQMIKNSRKMLISVTHRMTTLSKYDEIWFVQDGKIAAKGSFEEVFKNSDFNKFYTTVV